MVYWPHTAEPVPTQGPVSTHESLSTPGPVSTLGPVSTPGPTLEIELQPTDSLITVFTIVALALVTIIAVVTAIAVFMRSRTKKSCRATITDKPYEEIKELSWIQEPLFIPQSRTNRPQHFPLNDDPIVLVIYSPDSPEKDQQIALHYLVRGLSKYHIQIKCHDCSCIRQSAPFWLQEEFRRASTILCVCNAQFQREWDQKTTSLLPLVSSLRELVYGLLSQSISLSKKFAIVLLRESDHKHIPCDYLRNTRKFLVTDVKDIALFVTKTLKYDPRFEQVSVVDDPLVLVIYSPDSPDKDQQLALHNLVLGLSNYHIQIKCHDCSCIRQSVLLQLQEEFQRVSTVLCFCNARFHREWYQKTTSQIPLVTSLQELVYGLVSQSIPFSGKFAIVVLHESDRKHIQCDYLQNTKTFLVTDVEDIALFVSETPIM